MGVPALAVSVLVLKSRVCAFGVRSGRPLHWGVCLPHGPELQLAFVSFALGWWEMPVPRRAARQAPAPRLRLSWAFAGVGAFPASAAVQGVPARARLSSLSPRVAASAWRPFQTGSRRLLWAPTPWGWTSRTGLLFPQVPFSLCGPRAGGLSHVMVSRPHAPGPQLTARVRLPATWPSPGPASPALPLLLSISEPSGIPCHKYAAA